MHANLWIAGREFRKKRDKRIQSPEHGSADPQGADRLPVRRDGTLGFSNVLQDLSTCSQENDALVRETDATRGTVQKRGAESLFEAQNRAAHCALAHAELGRGGCKPAFIGDRLKHL